MRNYLPVLTEKGRESNLGRKVRQPWGGGCRDRKSGHCGREVEETDSREEFEGDLLWRIQNSAKHEPSFIHHVLDFNHSLT